MLCWASPRYCVFSSDYSCLVGTDAEAQFIQLKYPHFTIILFFLYATGASLSPSLSLSLADTHTHTHTPNQRTNKRGFIGASMCGIGLAGVSKHTFMMHNAMQILLDLRTVCVCCM